METSEICRACLSSHGKFHDLQTTITDAVEMSLWDALEAFTGMKLSRSSEMPRHVCSRCYRDLNYFCEFVRQCKKTEVTLVQIFVSKEEPSDESADCSDIAAQQTESTCANDAVATTFATGIEDGSEAKYLVSNADEKFDESDDESQPQMEGSSLAPFKCGVCKKTFIYESRFATHIRSHDLSRPYACEFCNCRYSTKATLYVHYYRHPECAILRRTSRGYKPRATNSNTVCKICQKKFKSAALLRVHQVVHTKERPYICEVCGKGFGQPQHVKTHLRTHTGEKPFSCEKCGDRFTVKHSALKHQASCKRTLLAAIT